jgi:hypothetical protein
MSIPDLFTYNDVTLTIYVVLALLGTTIISAIVGYGINNSLAASSTTQQSSTIQQSSDQSQSSSSSSSVVISQNNGGDAVSSSSNTIISRTDGDLRIDRQSSGKIASSHLNLTSGEVDAVLFGDWSLNGTAGFITNFIYRPANGTDPIEYEMNGLGLRSVSEINDNLVLAGTIDVASNSTATLQDTPVTIMIQNGILVVGFEKGAETNNLFGGIPILGFEQ